MAPTPNDLTRQQLDELDTLLQKMLALPLTRTEPVAVPAAVELPAPPAGWRADRAAAAVPAPHPAAVEVPALMLTTSRMEPPAVPMFPASYASPPPPTPSEPYRFVPPAEMPMYETQATAPAIGGFGKLDLAELMKDVDPFAAPPAPDLPSLAELETEPKLQPRLPVPAYPLVGLNWMMEALLHSFGPPGQLLTRPWGKHLLAGVGVLLLLGAGAWTANGMGWVKLPLPRTAQTR